MKDLNMRATKASQRAKDDFVEADWIYDTSARTWTHKNGAFCRLDRSEAATKAQLLDKVIGVAVKNKLPTEKTINGCIDDLNGSKNAMLMLMSKEKTFKMEDIK
jgi:hypothetical protein